MVEKPSSLKDLVQGIDSMLLRHRSTFSDAEVTLLHNLRADLQKRMSSGIALDPISFVKVLELLARVFAMLDFFQDMGKWCPISSIEHGALAALDKMSQ